MVDTTTDEGNHGLQVTAMMSDDNSIVVTGDISTHNNSQ